MSFASIEFFLFLGLVFALYYLRPGKSWQNGVLVAASYFFYGWWDYRFCFLMLASSLLDYWAGLAIRRSASPKHRKRWLILSIASNLGLLGFFKYFNFFQDSFVILLSSLGFDFNTSTLAIILPVGISFYTFQTMSYTLDIYRGGFDPKGGLIDYLAFVSFFPQLVAGPIERAKDLLPQFLQPRVFAYEPAVRGCRLILWGIVKKLILADNLGLIADQAYASAENASSALLLLGTAAFSFQIYCDFSAYSDIASGTALLFGVRLTRNFAYPYFSQNITEFWRRWHISLSAWFRDYVYVPLGGRTANPRLTARNLFLTFLISGLWHGASWNFIAWGALHGALAAASARAGFHPRRPPVSPPLNTPPSPRWPGWKAMTNIFATFLWVASAWVLFRAEDLSQAGLIYKKIVLGLLTSQFLPDLLNLIALHRVTLCLWAGFVLIEWINQHQSNPLPLPRRSRAGRWAIYTLCVWAALYYGASGRQEFIYFQF